MEKEPCFLEWVRRAGSVQLVEKGPNLFLNGPGSSKTPKETRLHINSQHLHWTSTLQPLLTAIKSNSSRSPGPLLYDDQGYLVPTLGASRPDIPTGIHLPSRPPQVFVSSKHSRQARGRQNPAPWNSSASVTQAAGGSRPDETYKQRNNKIYKAQPDRSWAKSTSGSCRNQHEDQRATCTGMMRKSGWEDQYQHWRNGIGLVSGQFKKNI